MGLEPITFTLKACCYYHIELYTPLCFIYIYVHARPKVLDVSIILTLRCLFRLKCSYVGRRISDQPFVRFVFFFFFFFLDIPSVDLVEAVFI